MVCSLYGLADFPQTFYCNDDAENNTKNPMTYGQRFAGDQMRPAPMAIMKYPIATKIQRLSDPCDVAGSCGGSGLMNTGQ
jgi:hypothetical protein